MAWGNSATEFGIELDQRKDIQKEFFEICKKLEKNSLDDVLSFIEDSDTALKALKDVPSWAKVEKPYKSESGNDFAKRLLNEKYGPENYKKGSSSDFNKIRKWGDRSFD